MITQGGGNKILLVDSSGNPIASLGLMSVAEALPYELRGTDAGIPLITSAQAFTAAWADLGPEIALFGRNSLTLWLTIDINDSTDLQFRVLPKHESGGLEEYEPPIETYTASKVDFQGGYHELAVDADVLIPITMRLNGTYPYGQVQIKAGTLGTGTDAEVDAAYYTLGTFGGGS